MQIDMGPDVETRVIRRAEVGKMARALQNSLALAGVKIKHGWENLSIDAIEPRIAREYHRRRPDSSRGTPSSSSSSIAGDISSRGLASSPLTAPMFSDENDVFPASRQSTKRRRTTMHPRLAHPTSGCHAGRKSRNHAAIRSWKKTYNLPQSSPVVPRLVPSRASFVSTSTVPDTPGSPALSEDDDADLPVSSFSIQQSMVNPSPPRTPKATGMLHRNTTISWSRTPRNDEEGADLLMYLATSPTPGIITSERSYTSSHSVIPSTPPSTHSALPSSILHTPGYTGLFNVPNTPSNNVNFADFCNVTPSPARWQKTPATAILRTPVAVSSTKGALNPEQLAPRPPAISPTPGRITRSRDAVRT